MKSIAFIFFGLLAFSCKRKLPNFTCEFEKNLKNSEIEFVTVPNYDGYEQSTDLKGGYRFEFRTYKVCDWDQIMQSTLLLKDHRIMYEFESYDIETPVRWFANPSDDFENCFTLTHALGSGNPLEFELIDKKTGKSSLSGIRVAADERAQILVYIDDDHREGLLFIYDIKNQNTIIANGFENSKCCQFTVAGLRSCVEIDCVSSDEVVLKIDNDDERIFRKFRRTKRK